MVAPTPHSRWGKPSLYWTTPVSIQTYCAISFLWKRGKDLPWTWLSSSCCPISWRPLTAKLRKEVSVPRSLSSLPRTPKHSQAFTPLSAPNGHLSRFLHHSYHIYLVGGWFQPSSHLTYRLLWLCSLKCFLCSACKTTCPISSPPTRQPLLITLTFAGPPQLQHKSRPQRALGFNLQSFILHHLSTLNSPGALTRLALTNIYAQDPWVFISDKDVSSQLETEFTHPFLFDDPLEDSWTPQTSCANYS